MSVRLQASFLFYLKSNLNLNLSAKRWYTVFVGSRVGVFANWYVHLVVLQITPELTLYPRAIANSFTSGVPGNSALGYSSRGAAESAFETARAYRSVKVVLPNGQAVVVV